MSGWGAAQPASPPGGAAQPTFFQLPADACELTVAYYNVGIPLLQVGTKSWRRKEAALVADIDKAVNMHAVDILCLCELGEVGVGIGSKLRGGDVSDWLRELLADSAAPPVAIYADGHYATLVMSDRIQVLEHRVVKNFVITQRYRCFQHFRVRTSEHDMPISIVNCHAPSSTKRTLTMDMRRRYFNAFHDACGADPFIWGGDFNTKVTQLTDLVERIDNRYAMNPSAAQPGSLQVVFSHPLQCKHGDLALTFGLDTAQVNSEIGFSYKGASDAHDLVVAKVFENTSRPAPRPESAASWSSSAAQPARQGPAGKVPNAEEPPEWPMPTRRTPRSRAEVSAASSAAQPARQQ